VRGVTRTPHHRSLRPRARAMPAGGGSSEMLCMLALLACAGLVAALTLSPQGTGWSYAAPLDELRWYSASLPAPAVLRQLLGNLALLALPAALLVRLLPTLRRPGPLACAALAAGMTIEVLQWLLPLGRVVSPLDAALNASGAFTVGWVVAHVRPGRPSADSWVVAVLGPACTMRRFSGPPRLGPGAVLPRSHTAGATAFDSEQRRCHLGGKTSSSGR
jgi:hypothetical protein